MRTVSKIKEVMINCEEKLEENDLKINQEQEIDIVIKERLTK